MNLREHIGHSGFEIQSRRRQKSKTGVSVTYVTYILHKLKKNNDSVLKILAYPTVLQVIADIVAKNDGIERCLEDEFICTLQNVNGDEYLKKSVKYESSFYAIRFNRISLRLALT